MKITFLGTGTSQGVPMIGCDCSVCNSMDYRDQRLRTSVHIAIDNKSIVIDCGPDFRQQILRERIKTLDAIIFTHQHKDHVAGLDDIRGFNYLQKKYLDTYARQSVIDHLKKEFYYAFDINKYPGSPDITMHEIKNENFEIEGIKIIPIEALHYKLEVFGFRIGDFTYLTDTNYISEIEQEKISGSKIIVLNGLQKEYHVSHFTLYQAVDLLKKWHPEKAYLTHISHRLGLHAEVEKELPAFIKLAYDGLMLEL